MRAGKRAAGIAWTVVILLSGCGSGDDGGGTGGTGVTRNGASVGVIVDKSSTGEVTMNGVRFSSAGARVSVDGAPASLDALAVGMVAKVRGTIHGDETGAAQSIEYTPTLIGPIEQVAGDRLTVLSQAVLLSGTTVCRDEATGAIACSTLRLGETLAVSGLVDGNGAIHASFIERQGAGVTLYRACGRMSDLNRATQTFAIEALQVSYGLATGDIDQLEDGRTVSAVGLLGIVPGTLVAGRVTVVASLFASEQEGDDAEVEGYVSAVYAPGHFMLDGETVRDNERTEYRGVTAQEVAVGMRLEVKGMWAGGVINARRVALRSRD